MIRPMSLLVSAVLVAGCSAKKPKLRTSEWMPTQEQVVYRYHGAHLAVAPTLEQQIEGAEGRVAGNPLALAELAGLYVELARRDGNEELLSKAEVVAKEALAAWGASPGAKLVLAKIANLRHQFDAAIGYAEPLLVVKPTATVYSILVSAYLAKGDLGRAQELAEKAAETRPSVAAYLMRALVLEAQGRHQEAHFDFAQTVRLEESGAKEQSARVRALWARFLLRRGEVEGAEQLLEESLKIAPGNALATGLLGHAAVARGDLETARQRFEAAFSTSRHVRYLIDEAKVRDIAGDRAGARAIRAQVERLVRPELGEGGLGHRLDLVEVLADAGDRSRCAEAVDLATKELAVRTSAPARFMLARAMTCAGAGESALKEIRKVLGTGDSRPEYLELAGYLETTYGFKKRGRMYRAAANRLGGEDARWRTVGLSSEKVASR